MANQWFKFYGGEYLSDPKIERLSSAERSCWITLLCMASMNDGIIEYMTVESLLTRSGVHQDIYNEGEWERSLGVLRKFVQMKMIKLSDDADCSKIVIINWEKRQEHNLTVAERVAKMRRKRRDVTTNVTNVTTEENRIEENRIEENTLSSESDEDFNTFWKEYPRKVGKGAADKAWRKLRPSKEIALKITDSLSAHIASIEWQRDDGRFIPHPATYINQERWLDEVVAAPKLISYKKY